SAENSTLGPRPGTQPSTLRSRAATGMELGSRHGAASPYTLPSDRSLAATQRSANHGWFSSRATNCCPTRPVAPRTPTSSLCIDDTGRSMILLRNLEAAGIDAGVDLELAEFEVFDHRTLDVLGEPVRPVQAVRVAHVREHQAILDDRQRRSHRLHL